MVTSGVCPDGSVCSWSIDGYLKKTLDVAKIHVKEKNWDYLAIVSGLPGSGKSNFAQSCAQYCCEWFNESYICFTAQQFIDVSNSCPDYSSIILDESFESMNTKVTNSASFLKIVNHLQLIRQKHLFIFLCLPNFFDLSKGIACFRSNHLFVTYSKDGIRGSFCAFSRESKKNLYIDGSKYLNYNAVPSNYIGSFRKQKCISELVYEKLKRRHLMEQSKIAPHETKDKRIRNILLKHIKETDSLTTKELSKLTGLDKKTIYKATKEDGDK